MTPTAGITWQVFKNPVTLFIGGVAAVLMEFGDDRIAHGVWQHSDFRTNPLARMQRTGLAALVTVYAARSVAERMIAGVVRRHETVSGRTPSGDPYHANEGPLLDWVQLTASTGFAAAYDRFVRPLSDGEWDAVYAEAAPGAMAYGVPEPATSRAIADERMAAKQRTVRATPIVKEFLSVVRSPRAVPWVMRPVQGVLIRAAVSILPPGYERALGLAPAPVLSDRERGIVRLLARTADRLPVETAPPVIACRRMGLDPNRLYAVGR